MLYKFLCLVVAISSVSSAATLEPRIGGAEDDEDKNPLSFSAVRGGESDLAKRAASNAENVSCETQNALRAECMMEIKEETGNLSLKKEASTDAKYSRADKICVGLGRIKSTCFKFVTPRCDGKEVKPSNEDLMKQLLRHVNKHGEEEAFCAGPVGLGAPPHARGNPEAPGLVFATSFYVLIAHTL